MAGALVFAIPFSGSTPPITRILDIIIFFELNFPPR
jgi:hypothetical protein